MVWRICFSRDDLDRIQLRPTLGPLAETVLAVGLLRDPQQPRALLSEWRGQVQGRVSPRLRPLATLIPPGCKGVDLPTLTGETNTIEQGVQALLEVPREHLLVEMAYTNRFNRLSPAAWALAEPGSRPDLAEAAEAAYHDLIQPYWHRINATLHAEQAARRRTLTREGAAQLLASLQGPRIRWRPPVLEIGMPSHVDMDLGGRGLALIPSVFIGRDPSLHENPNDEDETPRLILPAADAGRAWIWERRRSPGAALAALVGRNRAAVLASVADGCTTTELARRAGVSLAAASQHAAVLRGAGLIASRRQGSAVLHVLTPLGAELLQAG
ncbi:MAG TPA: winged helix-turn-helix domain-containing protein [Streptosporangiaceae bacterium]|nr:winged helix-turn-helix domain-containing protein [Streptosporangiaceae bacterium]